MPEVLDIQPILTPQQRMHLLFRAKMYREYACFWDGDFISRAWMRNIIRLSKADCILRARQALKELRDGR